MRVLPAALALSAVSLAAPAAAAPISQLVVFGDSNVDIGRLSAELAGDANDGQVPPPNTVAGRSSDGPILPEYVVGALGVPQLNFAWGGATAGETNIVGALFDAPDVLPTGTLSQIDEFEAALMGAPADADALYLVFAGSNDLFFADKDDQGEVDAAVASAEANLTDAVTRLAGLGAEDIVVATRTPRPVLSDAPRPAEEPDTEARNDAAGRQLNAVIRDLVPELDADLGAEVALFDDYAIIRGIIDASFAPGGFEAYSPNPSQFCISRDDCSDLINYDAAHKTSAVHAVLADRFVERFDLTPVAPIPLPAAGWLLLVGAGGLIGFGWRRR